MILQRLREDEYGTHGELRDDDNKPIGVFTLEQQYRDNEHNISCIKPGTFKLIPHNTDHFHDVWQLLDVPGRDAILIHAGNTIKDTHGCILVGLQAIPTGVGQSQAALSYLRTLLTNGSTLTVRGIEDGVSTSGTV